MTSPRQRIWQGEGGISLKRRATQGETLVETLISLLIGGLALLMLAVVIASVSQMVATSKTTMNEYYQDANNLALANVTANGGDARVEMGTATLVDSSGEAVFLAATVPDDSASEDGATVKDVTYVEDDVAGQPVVSYWAGG